MPHRSPARVARLSCLYLALLAGGAPVTSAHAQAPAAAARSYAIPAGPLATALNRLGRESGTLISFAPELAAGMQTAGLAGTHTVPQALSALLAGTGLVAVGDGTGSYALRRAPAVPSSGAATSSGAAALAEVRVTAAADRSGITEQSGSYTTPSMGTATRLGLSVRETPQSVSVITRQQMDDLGATRLEDVMAQVTGITVRRERAPAFLFHSRGFKMSRQFDGLPLVSLAEYAENSQELAIYDRIEVLRGAAGLTQGFGEPGGTVNLVRKRPTREFQGSVQLSAGSWDDYRAELDLSGPLVQDGRIRGRLVAAGQDARSFQHTLNERNGVMYGVVDVDLLPGTTLSLGGLAQRAGGRLEWWGIPFYADGSSMGLPRSTYLGADWNSNVRKRRALFASLEHELAGDWRFKASLQRNRDRFDNLQVAGLGPGWSGVPVGSRLIEPMWWRFENNTFGDAAGAELSGSYDALGRRHKLVLALTSERGKALGYDAGYDTSSPSWTFPSLVDVDTWNTGAFPDPSTQPYVNNGVSNTTRRSSTGLLAATHLSVTDATKLILGGRYTRYRNSTVYAAAPQLDAQQITTKFSPYAGVVHDLGPQWSLYASYSDIFQPQSSRMASGGFVKPIIGANYEAGIKHESANKRLNASLAVFRINQNNRAYLDAQASLPCSVALNPCYLPSGEVRSQGFEADLAGEFAPGWQMAAGYTFTSTKYLQDADNANRPYSPYTPRHMLRVSTSYRLPEALGPWTVGGSLRVQSRHYVQDGDARMQQGGYAVAGLMAQYAIDRQTTLSLNVDNLFDKTYWDNLGTLSYDNFYGRPRSATVTVRHRF